MSRCILQAGARARVLIVDEDLNSLRELQRVLRVHHPEREVITVQDPRRAITLLERDGAHALISEALFRELRGIDLVEAAARHDPTLPCLIVTSRPDLAPRRNLYPTVQRVIVKPADAGVIEGCVARALRLRASPVAAPRETQRAVVSAIACSTSLSSVRRALGYYA